MTVFAFCVFVCVFVMSSSNLLNVRERLIELNPQIHSTLGRTRSEILRSVCVCVVSLTSPRDATNYSHRCLGQTVDVKLSASTDAIGDDQRVPPACCMAAGFSPAMVTNTFIFVRYRAGINRSSICTGINCIYNIHMYNSHLYSYTNRYFKSCWLQIVDFGYIKRLGPVRYHANILLLWTHELRDRASIELHAMHNKVTIWSIRMEYVLMLN